MKYLTKSKFKLGLECPTKLYYTDKEVFPNQKVDDPFLEQLANGGFQVEAMARLMYDDGVLIDARNRVLATQQTDELLRQTDAIISEASFLNGSLNVRTDIVQKRGDYLKLIEVKAKSSHSSESIESEFLSKNKKKLDSSWEAYLWDIAFQTYVAKLSYPKLKTSSYLLLVDKDAKASIDGIHQKFKITQESDDQRSNIKIEEGLNFADLGNALLVEKDVTEIILRIIEGEFIHSNGMNFLDNLKMLSENYVADIETHSLIGRKCKDCEFRLKDDEHESEVQLSGYNRCWLHDGRVKQEDLELPKTYDIYNSGFAKKVMAEEGVLLAKDLDISHLNNPSDKGAAYSRHDRQVLQLEDIQNGTVRLEFNREAFAGYQQKIVFPLNMIDFETCAMAFPFTKGMSPYETVAFQFSHHIIHADGKVEHATQWLQTEPHSFPNFDFVRALKAALSNNNGSIFRYHNHENSVLNQIKGQLLRSQESDIVELIEFIESITSFDPDGNGKIEGERCMIDLHRLINDCYYNTHFAHSLSLKAVLPAIIKMDNAIQTKYSKEIGENGVTSLNFEENHKWLMPHLKDGLDPYHLLPKPFAGLDDEQLASFMSEADDTVSNGGTAMMAYAMLQYTDMQQEERRLLELSLLKYCELDTLAMVFVWEHLDTIKRNII